MFLLREKVIAFLTALGVTGAGADALLEYVIQSVTKSILNDINQPSIPEGLESVSVYMAAGQYLQFKKGSGQLEGFDLETAIKQIQEGDTNITFALGAGSLTPEQRLDGLIVTLMNSGAGQFAAYRRLEW